MKRILSFLGAILINIVGFAAIMVYAISVMILFREDQGLGLYLYGGGLSMMLAWLYFSNKYAQPLIRIAIHQDPLC